MIKTINEYDFTRAFQEWDSRKNQFSYGALKAIFAYYEEIEESTGEPIELDIVATCCEFTEYDSLAEVYDNYSEKENSDELTEDEMREWLEDRTTVLDVENVDTSANEYRTIKSIVIVNF